MSNVDPNASEELQDYLRREFDPTPAEHVEGMLDWGWHRVKVRPKRFRSFPFVTYQLNTLTPYTSELTQPPVMMTAKMPAGNPRVPVSQAELLAVLAELTLPAVLGNDLDLGGYDILNVGDMQVNSLSAAPVLGPGLSSSESSVPALAASIGVTTDLDLGGNDLLDVGDAAVDSISAAAGAYVVMADHLDLDGSRLVLTAADVNTYIYSSGANAMDFVANSVTMAAFLGGLGFDVDCDIHLDQNKKLYLDQNTNTWLGGAAVDDQIPFWTGGNLRMLLSNAGMAMGTTPITSGSTFDGRDVGVDGTAWDTLLASFATGKILVGSGAGTYAAKGQLFPLHFGYHTAASGAGLLLYGDYPAVMGTAAERDYYFPAAATLVMMTAEVDINAYVSGDVEIRMYKNGANTADISFTPTGVGDGQHVENLSMSVAISAGDYVYGYRFLTDGAGAVTTDDIRVTMWFRMDAP